MDTNELEALVGLLLAIGVNKQSDVYFREYLCTIFGNKYSVLLWETIDLWLSNDF